VRLLALGACSFLSHYFRNAPNTMTRASCSEASFYLLPQNGM
jgi:hypothetical protein